MEDKSGHSEKTTESLEAKEVESETVLLDAESATKETLTQSDERKPDSYRDVLRRLSETSAEVAQTSGEFGAVFNVRALVGKTLAKKYEILERVGRGGMGTVFLAKDITLERDVAVKVLNPSLSDDEISLNRFLREAKLVSRLKHPNAISLYEFGVEGAVPYLVMEYVDGISLEQLIADEGPLDVMRTNAILQQVCAALQSAHELGILHRDLKPDNIMVSRRADGFEFVQVLDFGMAKVLDGENERGPKVSSTGVPCGTPHYMAPELITAQDVDLRADIYALGMIAFQMLVGKTPFEDFSTVEILYHQFHTIPPLVTEANPVARISRGIEKTIAQAMEKHPDDRFQSVEDFAERFDGHISDDFIFVSGSQTPRVVAPYRSHAMRARRFRSVRSPLFKFWLAWFLITVSVTTVIWCVGKFRYEIEQQVNVALIHLEDSLGFRLEGWRKIADLERYGTKEEAIMGAEGLGSRLLSTYVYTGRNIDIRDDAGNSLLHLAVLSRNGTGIDLLLRYGINPSTRNKKGTTPLMMAASQGATGFVHALIEHGAAVDSRDEFGVTALMFATEAGHLSAVHALLLQNAAINAADDSGRTALMYAIKSKNPDVLRFLLDQGAALEQKDSNGRTVLFYAVERDESELVSLLLERGATVDVHAQGNITPLMLAVSKQYYAIAKMLIEAGADHKQKNSLGVSVDEMLKLQGAEAYTSVFPK